MTTVISVIAILISITSLAINVRQNRSLRNLRKYEKVNSVIQHSLELRKKCQDLRIKIDSTDDVESCDELLNEFGAFVETQITALAEKETTSIPELFEIEKHLMSLELKINLLSMQVNEADKWNKEVQQCKATANNSFTANGPHP